ncbi:MAG: peptidylprolyl isomerase [bacterium]
MKKRYVVLCAVALAIFIAGCGKGTSGGKMLVSVNGEKITEGDLDFLSQINPRIQAQMSSPDGKQKIIDNLIEQDLLYQKAVKEGVNRDPKVKAKVDLYRRVIIAQSLIENEIDKSAKKYYDEHQNEFQKLKLSDITVKFASPDAMKNAKKGKEGMHSEEDALKIANEIKARIDKGEAFDAVAKDASEDMPTKNRGGDIGLVSKDDKRLIARGYGPLLEKAFEMKVGEVAGPIKTQDGYHIVTVTRGLELEPFEEAKQAVLFKVRGDVRMDLLAKLKKDAKIVYADELAAKKKAAEETQKSQAAQQPAAGENPAEAPTVMPAPGGQQVIKIPPVKPAEQAQATPPAKTAAPAAKKEAPAKKK